MKLSLLRRPRTVHKGVCVCAMLPMGTNTYTLKSGAGMLRRGQDDISPHFVGSSRATAPPRLRQQRYNCSPTAPALRTVTFVTATVLSCSYVCAVFTRRYIYTHNLYMHSIVIAFIRRRTSFCHTISSSSPRSKWGRLMILPIFIVRHPRDFKSTTSPRGTLQYTSTVNMFLPLTRAGPWSSMYWQCYCTG